MGVKGKQINKPTEDKNLDSFFKPSDEDYYRLEELKATIEEHGQIEPIILSQYGVISGKRREKLGCSKKIHIEVKDQYDHWVKRLITDLTAKSPTERWENRHEAVVKALEALKEKFPEKGDMELMEILAKDLKKSRKWVEKYRYHSYDRRNGDHRKISAHRTEKLKEERRKTYLAIARYYPEHLYVLREILRNEKPYFKQKDDIDLFYRLLMRQKNDSDPFDIFVKRFYLQWWGYRLRLPHKYQFALQFLANQGEDPETVLIRLIDKALEEKGIEEERLVELAKKRLLEEWLIEPDGEGGYKRIGDS